MSEANRNLNWREIAGIVSIIGFLLTLFIYSELDSIGFPDGSRTTYNKATIDIYIICNWINLVFALYFLSLIFFPSVKIKALLLLGVIFFALFLLSQYGVHFYYREYLRQENGEGG
jgi:hypothetical protein